MDIRFLKIAKEFVNVVVSWCNTMSEKGYVDLPSNINFSDLYINDLASFVMYIIAADKIINFDEVEVYKYLTGYGGDNFESVKKYIEEEGIMSYDFQSKIPLSFQFAVKATNKFILYCEESTVASFIESYITSFVYAGREMMKADDKVSFLERRDFELYIKNLIDYAEENSYATFKEPLINLLTN